MRRREHRLIVRFVQPGDELGERLVVRDAGGHSKPGLGSHRFPRLRRDDRADSQSPLLHRVLLHDVSLHGGYPYVATHGAYVLWSVFVVGFHAGRGGVPVTGERGIGRRTAARDPPFHLGGEVDPTLVEAELLARAEPGERGADLLGARAVRR